MKTNLDQLAKTGEALGAGLGVITAGLILYRTWRKKQRQRDLLDHPIFARLDDALRIHQNLPIADRMRKEAFQDLLEIKFRTWRVEIERWLRSTKFDGLDDRAMREALCSFLRSTVALYEQQAEAAEIPHIVVEKFRIWHQEAVDQTMVYLRGICDSDWVCEPHDRLASFLFYLMAALERTTIDAEDTLADLNGDLDGVVYKGWVGEHYVSPKRARGLEAAQRAHDAAN